MFENSHPHLAHGDCGITAQRHTNHYEAGNVIRRILKPRLGVPMGFALGLFVLYELGVVPVPFDPGANPIAAAAIAIGMGIVGAIIGYFVQVLLRRLLGD